MPPSAAPCRPDSGLTVGATGVQLGGTANAPIAAPRPMAADTEPPRAAQSRNRGRHRTADSVGCCRRFPGPGRRVTRSRAAEQTRKGTQRVSRHVEAG